MPSHKRTRLSAKHGIIVFAILFFYSMFIFYVQFHAISHNTPYTSPVFKSKLDTSLARNKEYNVRVPPLFTDAYNICCRTTNPQSAKVPCKKEDDRWFDRLVSKSELVSTGGATLYWAHMRKVCN